MLQLLYKFDDLAIDGDYRQWRHVNPNGVKPDSIRHMHLQEIGFSGDTVYVSTVHHNHWKHIMENNHVIDSWTTRDNPRFIENESINKSNK